MIRDLTQRRMIINFETISKGDFYWRLKYLIQALSHRNPEDETALTQLSTKKYCLEHVHEIFNFLAVFFLPIRVPALVGKGTFVMVLASKNRTCLKNRSLSNVHYLNINT